MKLTKAQRRVLELLYPNGFVFTSHGWFVFKNGEPTEWVSDRVVAALYDKGFVRLESADAYVITDDGCVALGYAAQSETE